MTIAAFVNQYSDATSFARGWLSSPDFHATTLARIVSQNNLPFVSKKKGARTKFDYANAIVTALESGTIAADVIVRYYALESRPWLSFRLGTHDGKFHAAGDAGTLVTAFGEVGWYGPIFDPTKPKHGWYIRTFEIPCHLVNPGKNISKHSIRWSLIAEVSETYVALSWKGFSQTSNVITSDGRPQKAQYPFWLDIPTAFSDLEEALNAQWQTEDLFKLVLNDLWEKYREQSDYDWLDIRIRAEKAGVIVNAHSSRVKEISGRGLRAFSSKLAHAAVDALPPLAIDKQLSREEAIRKIENGIIRTLIREWGTKSYEFSLNQKIKDTDEDKGQSSSTDATVGDDLKPLFLAHCFFGDDEKEGSQDGLQHVHCAMSHGGSETTLQFLLRELETRGQSDGAK